MINISQHAIIPLGYPSQYGYYNAAGTIVNNSSTSQYRSLKKSYTFGCNRVYRAVPLSSHSSLSYGNIRLWDKSFVEPVQSSIVNFNQLNQSVFNFNGSYDINSFMTAKDTFYIPIINYPFLIFFKDKSPSVALNSLLGSSLNPDFLSDDLDSEIENSKSVTEEVNSLLDE